MGRKAKDAAQQKIGEWTSTRRNVSKTTTTTKNENTNASNENRTPLQTHSQSDINAMKNCSVRLDKIRTDQKTNETVGKTPVKDVPTADVIVKDKEDNAKNVYDYSFDVDDIPGPMKDTEDQMKDLFEKLAKENIIEVKKYRPKNAKKKKPDEKVSAKKETTQKRRREKQPIDVEPPKKKPNLKAKIDAPKSGTLSANTAAVPQKQMVDADNLANNNIAAKKFAFESKEITNAKVAIRSSPRKQANTVNTENVNVQTRLRHRLVENFQSTPKTVALKSSTPLGTKATAQSKDTNRSLNSLFFDHASPLTTTRATRANVKKHRLQLSAINDSQENESAEKPGQMDENEHVPHVDNLDDDDFDFGNNMPNEPEPVPDIDKENSWDQPSTSAAALNAQNKPSTSSATSSLWDQPSTSKAALRALDRPAISPTKTIHVISNVQIKPGSKSSVLRSRDQPSTSSAAQTPQRDTDRSVFDIQETSEYNIFSPTKRVQRVYGRSPLKNITSEVNNTNSPSFESIQSMPRSFGVIPKSATNSMQTANSTKDTSLTLPEASYFSSRRVAQDFDRNIDNQDFADNCFGFDDCDEEEIANETTNKESESAQPSDNDVTKSETEKLKEIRARLKRFLHNPDAEPNESIKMSKVTKSEPAKKKGKTPKKTPLKTPIKTPLKSPAKAVAKSPAKERPKRNIVFGDTGAKQKDIRDAFAVKTTDKQSGKSKEDPAALLFEDFDTVQDRRRSYSRPQRQRKRRISVDSDESEEEQEQSDDEEYDENGKPSKRAKRRKKTVEPNPKELEELDEFAKNLNAHFDEIDSFSMVVE